MRSFKNDHSQKGEDGIEAKAARQNASPAPQLGLIPDLSVPTSRMSFSGIDNFGNRRSASGPKVDLVALKSATAGSHRAARKSLNSRR